MTPQEANYFTHLEAETAAFKNALQDLNARIQEGVDRGYNQTIGSIEFEGELDHLTPAKVGALLTGMQALNATMIASSRAIWIALYGVIR